MTDIWFISDTHFFHANILKFHDKTGKRTRPEFQSLEEMHEALRDNWNTRVKPQDKIYHLGDVTFQYHAPFQNLMSRLNGHKRLVVGNHDKLKQPGLVKWFEKIELWRGFKSENFTCSHLPLRLDGLRDGQFNVHGHTHQNNLSDPHYINICVEQTGYKPLHMDEVKSIIASRM